MKSSRRAARWASALAGVLTTAVVLSCAKPAHEATGSSGTGAERAQASPSKPSIIERLAEAMGSKETGTPNPTWFFPIRLGPDYALDDIDRYLEEGEKPDCPTEELVSYRGTSIRYAAPVRVHKAFTERLARLEELVSEVAIEHFGRAPRRIYHHGAYNCRSVRRRSYRMSEHALGNAIDISGFGFPALRKKDAPEDLPRALRRRLNVRIDRHWEPRRERDAPYAAFLHDLLDRLRSRPDIVRGIVGPPHRLHRNHIHLDVAPWRYAFYHHGETPFEPPAPLVTD